MDEKALKALFSENAKHVVVYEENGEWKEWSRHTNRIDAEASRERCNVNHKIPLEKIRIHDYEEEKIEND